MKAKVFSNDCFANKPKMQVKQIDPAPQERRKMEAKRYTPPPPPTVTKLEVAQFGNSLPTSGNRAKRSGPQPPVMGDSSSYIGHSSSKNYITSSTPKHSSIMYISGRDYTSTEMYMNSDAINEYLRSHPDYQRLPPSILDAIVAAVLSALMLVGGIVIVVLSGGAAAAPLAFAAGGIIAGMGAAGAMYAIQGAVNGNFEWGEFFQQVGITGLVSLITAGSSCLFSFLLNVEKAARFAATIATRLTEVLKLGVISCANGMMSYCIKVGLTSTEFSVAGLLGAGLCGFFSGVIGGVSYFFIPQPANNFLAIAIAGAEAFAVDLAIQAARIYALGERQGFDFMEALQSSIQAMLIMGMYAAAYKLHAKVAKGGSRDGDLVTDDDDIDDQPIPDEPRAGKANPSKPQAARLRDINDPLPDFVVDWSENGVPRIREGDPRPLIDAARRHKERYLADHPTIRAENRRTPSKICVSEDFDGNIHVGISGMLKFNKKHANLPPIPEGTEKWDAHNCAEANARAVAGGKPMKRYITFNVADGAVVPPCRCCAHHAHFAAHGNDLVLHN